MINSHKRVYVGPYIKFPAPTKCPDVDRLMLAASENFDTWLPNVGDYDLFQADHGGTPDPCSLTADMINTKAFADAFCNEIKKLRELYGTGGVIEFGIVTISNETPW